MKAKFQLFQLITALLISFAVNAQIYEPDGLRMPGDWNGWVNTTGMGGVFDLQRIHTGTPRWQTIFQYTGATGSQNFKFASTSFSNPWGNQWAGNVSFAMNSFANVTFGTPSDPNNKINVVKNKFYTTVFQDNGYANTQAIFMETSNAPVTISSVTQEPMIVTNLDPVAVTIQLSGMPSPEEKFYLLYSLNTWNTTALVPVSITGTTGTATIPAQPNDTTVEYYIFSTVIQNPTANFDLVSIKINNNNDLNYIYTVGTTVDCGQGSGLVTTDPAFTQESLPVTVYFNAELGNGGLYNYTGDVYAHTGVITNLSTSNTDWKYVKTNWGQNTPDTRLTRIEPNLYSLTINNIRQYYGVPVTEQILKLAFVFRGGEPWPSGNYPEAKNADGSDIMVEVYIPALRVKITNPTARDPLASPNQVLPVCVSALQNQSISIYLDQTLLKTENASSLSWPLILQGMNPGTYWIKAVATGNTGQARDSVSIYLRGPVIVQELPTGVKSGINYVDNTTVTLVLHDPAGLKGFAFAIGDFSNWLPNDQNYMKRTPDGKYFWVTLPGLTVQKEYAYQYFIDGKIKTADPWCDKILDPWNDKWIPKSHYPNLKSYPFDKTTGTVSVFQTNQTPYPWQVTNFTPSAINATQQDLFVYELLLRDFTDSSTITMALDKLDYIKNLGINAIELMPVSEFDGNQSWGYAPNFYFAPDKFYGTKNDYRKFIDECHKRGMAVIIDIVMNHCFGQCPMVGMYFDPSGSGQPSAQNPWLNTAAPHPLSIGYDFNHESPYTRDYFKKVLAYWLTEYKADGFRFDLSKGLTQKNTGSDLGAWAQYDQSRVDILTDYYNHIKSVNSNAYVILEHFAVNDEEKVLANNGLMLWGAMQDKYKQVGIGWQSNSDFSWAFYSNRGWNYPNVMDYLENHDQERIMYEALSNGNSGGGYNIKDTTTALNHCGMTAALMLGMPGPKMIYEFGELGYDYSINYNGDRTAPKPPRWDYFNNINRQRLYHIYSGMAALRKCDAFRSGTFTSDLGGLVKKMWISHNSMDAVICGNMDVAYQTAAPGFQHTGTWYEYFSGEQLNVTNPVSQAVTFKPGDFKVYTSVPLPKPYVEATITVQDSATQAVIAGAEVSLQNAGVQKTNTQGKATFLAFPGQNTIQVSKSGYITFTKTYDISVNSSITILLKKGSSGGAGESEIPGLRLYPNPATDQLTIESPIQMDLTINSMDGRTVFRKSMQSNTEMIDLKGFTRGIYLIRFCCDGRTITRKVVVQ